MDEGEPPLDRVRAASRDPCFSWPVEPFLHVRYQEECGHNKVVNEDSGDALVVILRASKVLLNEGVVDFESWWGAEGRRIEHGDGALHSAGHALHRALGNEDEDERRAPDDARRRHVHRSSCPG